MAQTLGSIRGSAQNEAPQSGRQLQRDKHAHEKKKGLKVRQQLVSEDRWIKETQSTNATSTYYSKTLEGTCNNSLAHLRKK
jgi:hypothetical protein